MTKSVEKIYQHIEGKELNYGTELNKKEYAVVKTRALKEMSETVQALMHGKSKEEMEKAGKWK